MPQPPAQELIEYAAEHGTTAAAYIAAGWDPAIVMRRGRPALAFRTRSGRRYRFIDNQKPKYDQDIGYQACWYGLQRAVTFGLDILVDCNGAPSTVPAQARGVPAFSLQAGETTSPTPELIAELREAWSGPVLVAFDCDRDGRSGAVKRVQLYRANGIPAEAVDLGLEKSGADLADFLIVHGETGLSDLLSAPRLDIPALVQRPKPASIERADDDNVTLAQLALDALAAWRRDTYYAWVEVGMALTDLGQTGLVLWERWSATSDKYKPGDCAKKWKSFKRQGMTLASLFYLADTDYGPTWRPYRAPIRVDANLTPTPLSESERGNYPASLPTAVRGALNSYAHPSVAPVLELWLEGLRIGALEPGEAATVECLSHISRIAGRGLSIHTIRTGLKHATDPHHHIFLRVLQHYSITSNEGDLESSSGKTLKNSNPCKRRGRFPDVYELLPWQTILAALARLAVAPILARAFPVDDETVAPIRAEFLHDLGRPDADRLAAQLNAKYAAVLEAQPGYREALEKARREYERLLWALSNPQTAPIPDGWTYKNASEYQACCARAIVEAAGGETQYSHKRLCELIGCSQRNLKTVLERAGIWIAKDGTTVDAAMKSAAQIRAIRGYNKRVQGYPVAVVSSLNSAPYPLEKAGVYVWAEGEFKKGAKVSVRYQQAHRQLLDTVGQPQKPKTRLLWAAFTYLCGLFEYLLSWLVRYADEDEPERDKQPDQPVIMASVWVRLYVQLQLKRLFDWLARNYRPPQRKESYSEMWLRKLTGKVTSWQADPDRLLDRETGEVADYSVQTTLDKLIEAETPVNKPASIMPEIMTNNMLDPLLDYLVNECGGTITAVEPTVEDECRLAA